jgi:YidC/Oxa1 family membrane protein insertase
MDPKNRFLYFGVLLALALAATFLLDPPASQRAQSAAKAPAAAKGDKQSSTPQPPPSPAASPGPTPEQARARVAAQRLATLTTEHFTAQVTNLNGGLKRFELKGRRYRAAGKALDIVTTDKESYLPLAIELDGGRTQPASTWQLTQPSARSLLLAADIGSLHVTRKLQAGKGPYQLWLTTHIENRGTTARKVRLSIPTHHYVTREAEGATIPLLPVRNAPTSHGLCRHAGDLERIDRKSLKAPQNFSGAIAFAGVENVYFLNAIAPDSGNAERCRVEASDRGRNDEGEAVGSLFTTRLYYPEVELAPGQSRTYRALAYLGPKSPKELGAAGHSLKESIESGWFTSLAEGLTWLLRVIYDGVGNWGIAIIVLTFLVKLVLFPVTLRQMQSMARMKELKPEIDRINQLYGDDREKKGAAIMELYRKRGVNPMAGCLPVLLQMPIWFSLYASLSSNVELFRAPFALWWRDLSSPDPIFVLPLALGVLMFVQQKMSPATGMDPVQQKMMLYMMPAMITSFMLFLPAGLCLYMFTNSALSIVQQRMIEARLSRSKDPPDKPQDPPAPQQPQKSTISTISPSRTQRSGRPSKAERRWRRGKR